MQQANRDNGCGSAQFRYNCVPTHRKSQRHLGERNTLSYKPLCSRVCTSPCLFPTIPRGQAAADEYLRYAIRQSLSQGIGLHTSSWAYDEVGGGRSTPTHMWWSGVAVCACKYIFLCPPVRVCIHSSRMMGYGLRVSQGIGSRNPPRGHWTVSLPRYLDVAAMSRDLTAGPGTSCGFLANM